MLNSLKYCLAVAVLVLSVIFVGGTFAWGIFLLLFIFITLGLLSGNSFAKNIVLLVWHDRLEYKSGEEIGFKLVLSNTGMGIVPWIQMDMEVPEKLAGYSESGKVLFLGPNGSTTSNYGFKANFKGKYCFENVKIVYSDILGLFKWTKRFDESFTFLVRPQVKKLVGFSAEARQPLGKYISKNVAFEDLSSIKDIRKYQTGDSFKKIHWKITAHRGELFIREPEATGSSEIILVLDLFKGAYSEEAKLRYQQEEQCAECAAALVYKAFQNGLDVKIQYYSDRMYTIKLEVEKGMDAFLELLATVEATSSIPVSEIIRNELGKFSNRSEILIVTNDIGRSFVSELNLKNSLQHITILSNKFSNQEKIRTGLVENGMRLKSFATSEKNVLIGDIEFENE